jgi:hypothetical protein
MEKNHMLRFSCPACSKSYSVTPEKAGRSNAFDWGESKRIVEKLPKASSSLSRQGLEGRLR